MILNLTELARIRLLGVLTDVQHLLHCDVHLLRQTRQTPELERYLSAVLDTIADVRSQLRDDSRA